MPTTSNFGWTTPADTDLVKDGALAIRTLGNGIDTSLVDLKGGTTGQILSKASNTDLDYTWINNDQGDITSVGVTSPITGGGTSGAVTIAIQDATTAQKGAVQLENSTSSTSTTTAAVPASVKSAYDLANAAIPKSLVDAKGDLLAATADDTVTRLAVGTNGQYLSADSTTATGLKWVTATSGGWTQLAAASLPTNATTVTISSLSTDYQMLVIMVRDFYPASDDYMKLRFNQNTGTVYGQIGLNHSAENTVAATADGSADAIWLNDTAMDNTSKENYVYIQIPNYANTVTHKSGTWNGKARNGANTYEVNWFGTFNFQSTSAITEVTIFTNGSNWSGGDYVIYGVK